MDIIKDFVMHSRKLSEGLMRWGMLNNAGKQVLWEKLNETCRHIASVFRPFWRHRDGHISLHMSSAADLWLGKLTVEVDRLWELTKKIWTMIQHEYEAVPFSTSGEPSSPRTPRSIWSETITSSFGPFPFGKRSETYAHPAYVFSSLDTMPETPASSRPSPISLGRERSATLMSPRRFFGSPTESMVPFRESFVSAAGRIRNRVLSFGSRFGAETKEIVDFHPEGAAFDHANRHKPTDSGVGSSDGVYSSPMGSQQRLIARTSTETLPNPSYINPLNLSISAEKTFRRLRHNTHAFSPVASRAQTSEHQGQALSSFLVPMTSLVSRWTAHEPLSLALPVHLQIFREGSRDKPLTAFFPPVLQPDDINEVSPAHCRVGVAACRPG